MVRLGACQDAATNGTDGTEEERAAVPDAVHGVVPWVENGHVPIAAFEESAEVGLGSFWRNQTCADGVKFRDRGRCAGLKVCSASFLGPGRSCHGGAGSVERRDANQPGAFGDRSRVSGKAVRRLGD